MIIYGIKNCDTVKKALNHLKAKGIEYEFHDFKKMGVTQEKLREWSKSLGWENLINRKGTTWRKLEDDQKDRVTNEDAAIDLMKNYTSLIKRPVIEKDGKLVSIGFNDEEFARKF